MIFHYLILIRVSLDVENKLVCLGVWCLNEDCLKEVLVWYCFLYLV